MDLSIIIPTYKPQIYFKDCLDSLLKQTFDRKRFEIIIILNGERDPHFDYINEITQNTAIKLIYSPESGVSNARNIGIEESRGDFLMFLDDDDWVSENYLEQLFSLQASDDAIIVSNMLSSEDGTGEIKEDYVTKSFSKCKKLPFSLFNFRGFLSSACGKIIPRNIIGKTRFIASVQISEDALFMFELSSKIKMIKLASEDCIYFRRIRSSSASVKRKSPLRKIEIYCLTILNFNRIYFSSPLKYSFKFYLSRLAASTKFFLINLSK